MRCGEIGGTFTQIKTRWGFQGGGVPEPYLAGRRLTVRCILRADAVKKTLSHSGVEYFSKRWGPHPRKHDVFELMGGEAQITQWGTCLS
jgi:hypothetical protein